MELFQNNIDTVNVKMKKYFSAIAVILLFSCSKRQENTIDQAVDLVIEAHNGRTIEFPYLYDELATSIPDNDSLKLATILRKKGFKEINSGHGNYPPRGPRIILKDFQKDKCLCTISKIYYFTTRKDTYEIAERISCSQKQLLLR